MKKRHRRGFLALALVVLPLMAAAARGADNSRQDDGVVLSPTRAFSEQTGESLFRNVCQGCHMPDAKGAVGAGHYPALAGDQSLASSVYPIYVVVHGLRGMPPVGGAMSDAQVAAVVNYVRSHFGNHFEGEVKAADVTGLRK